MQGLTLSTLFIDEVALVTESFYVQATARLSVEGAKLWTSSNPNSPYHWFYTNVIKKLRQKNGLYVHFTMRDNPSLSQEIIDRYEMMYSGVWKKRYIDGLWAVADGLVYDMFDDEYHVVSKYKIPVEDAKDWCIGIDYGTGNATVFLLMMKTYNDRIYAVKEYYYAGRKEAQENDDYSLQKTDREFAEDLKSFIIDNYNLTGKGYRNDIEIFVDPAAASFKVELRKHFRMKVKNADNEVIDGVRKVATRLSLGELFISEDCPNLIREFHNYMWVTYY